MQDPEQIKKRIQWLKEALDIIGPYHGRYVKRITEWKEVQQRLDSTSGAGQGYLMSSWFIDNAGASRVDCSGARNELSNQEAILASVLAAQSDPRFARLHELDKMLRTEWDSVRAAMSREEYHTAIRAGAFPRISWH